MGRRSGGVQSAGKNRCRDVRNHPLSALDPLGQYESEWEGSFTHAEKRAILHSVVRVKQRAWAWIKQTDDNIRKPSALRSSSAYGRGIKNLEHVERILEDMVRETEDPGWNLEVDRGDLGEKCAKSWNSPVPGYDDTLTLGNRWFHQSADEQDSTMLHELTNRQGAEDKNVPSRYNNAWDLEPLMHLDTENWSPFKRDKRMADKLRSRTDSRAGSYGGWSRLLRVSCARHSS
jgi:hypothetical protein